MYIWYNKNDTIRTPSISFVDFQEELIYELSIEKMGPTTGLMFYSLHIELLHTYRIWNTFGKAFTRNRPVYVDTDSIPNISPMDMDIWSRALLTQAFTLIDTNKKACSFLKFEIKEKKERKEIITYTVWHIGINPKTLKSIQSKISDLKRIGKDLKNLRHNFLAHKNKNLYSNGKLKLPESKESFDMGKLADYLEIASDILNTIAKDHNIPQMDYMLCQNADPNERRIP